MAVVSKMYCSASQAVMAVRRRPNVINGGGFVVADCHQKEVFRVDGCNTLGISGKLILRDGHGTALLLIRRKEGGILEALSIQKAKRWKGYSIDDCEGSHKPAFSLKEPNKSLCFTGTHPIQISLEPSSSSSSEVDSTTFEIQGSFPNRDCRIVDSNSGDTVAKVGVKKEMMISKDIYYVVVEAGIDQAFVFGVVAILDHIYGESTAWYHPRPVPLLFKYIHNSCHVCISN